MDRIKKSFLHHKLEAIKFVNEQLQNPGMAATDCTIASIAALALAEVSIPEWYMLNNQHVLSYVQATGKYS
jgi:hypothetical protein